MANIRGVTGFRRKMAHNSDAIGAIDVTPNEIYHPLTDSQGQFCSGNWAYHCLHSHVVVDANDVRCVESGFFNHLNDARTFGFMRQIGAELEFPNESV